VDLDEEFGEEIEKEMKKGLIKQRNL